MSGFKDLLILSKYSMNLPNLAQVRPIEFEGKIIIALDSNWLDFFKEDPQFIVSIKNDHLILSAKLNSQKIINHKIAKT